MPEGAEVQVVGRARRLAEPSPTPGHGGFRSAAQLFTIVPPPEARLQIALSEHAERDRHETR